MKFQRKYSDANSKTEHDQEKQIQITKNDIGHVINQIIIWSVIVFLSVVIVKKFF